MSREDVSTWLRPRRWIVGVALGCYTAALFTSTHIPLPKFEMLPKDSDKVMHFAAYAGLAWLLGLWFATMRPMTLTRYALVFAICVVYSIFDEVLQIFVRRHADVYDGLADALGSAIGLTILAASLAVLERLLRPVASVPGEPRA